MHATQVIERAGGPVALATALGIDHSSVVKWRARGKVPAARVPAISAITGIPRHELRPDLWEPPSCAPLAGAEAVP